MNTDEFEELKKLLALKRHELPPPGYFERLPRQILATLEAEQLKREESWLRRFWVLLQAKPAIAGALGVAVFGLIVTGILFSEKESGVSGIAAKPAPLLQLAGNQLVVQPTATDNSSTNPVLSAQAPAFLFDGSLVSSGALKHIPQPVDFNLNSP